MGSKWFHLEPMAQRVPPERSLLSRRLQVFQPALRVARPERGLVSAQRLILPEQALGPKAFSLGMGVEVRPELLGGWPV